MSKTILAIMIIAFAIYQIRKTFGGDQVFTKLFDAYEGFIKLFGIGGEQGFTQYFDGDEIFTTLSDGYEEFTALFGADQSGDRGFSVEQFSASTASGSSQSPNLVVTNTNPTKVIYRAVSEDNTHPRTFSCADDELIMIRRDDIHYPKYGNDGRVARRVGMFYEDDCINHMDNYQKAQTRFSEHMHVTKATMLSCTGNSCTIDATNTWAQNDPSEDCRKEVEIHYQCIQIKPDNLASLQTVKEDEHDHINIECPANQKIIIHSATYYEKGVDPPPQQVNNAIGWVRWQCDQLQTCKERLTVDHNDLTWHWDHDNFRYDRFDPSPSKAKELEIKYWCKSDIYNLPADTTSCASYISQQETVVDCSDVYHDTRTNRDYIECRAKIPLHGTEFKFDSVTCKDQDGFQDICPDGSNLIAWLDRDYRAWRCENVNGVTKLMMHRDNQLSVAESLDKYCWDRLLGSNPRICTIDTNTEELERLYGDRFGTYQQWTNDYDDSLSYYELRIGWNCYKNR